MAKIQLEELRSGFLDTEVLNANFARIAEALEKVLYRDGEAPNQMEADIDLNGNQILNPVPAVTDNQVPAWGQVRTYIDARGTGYVVQKQEQIVSTEPFQTDFTLQSFTYQPGSNNLGVFVQVGTSPPKFERLFALGGGFEEVSPSTFRVPDGIEHAGTTLVVTSNEYHGTLEPAVVNVSWDDVLFKPDEATRWPTYAEVTGKPSTFPPSAHTHNASDINAGRLADARRGVFVQSGAPSSPAVGDLWFW